MLTEHSAILSPSSQKAKQNIQSSSTSTPQLQHTVVGTGQVRLTDGLGASIVCTSITCSPKKLGTGVQGQELVCCIKGSRPNPETHMHKHTQASTTFDKQRSPGRKRARSTPNHQHKPLTTQQGRASARSVLSPVLLWANHWQDVPGSASFATFTVCNPLDNTRCYWEVGRSRIPTAAISGNSWKEGSGGGAFCKCSGQWCTTRAA